MGKRIVIELTIKGREFGLTVDIVDLVGGVVALVLLFALFVGATLGGS